MNISSKSTMIRMIFLVFLSINASSQNIDYQILKSIHLNRDVRLDPFSNIVSKSTSWISIAYPLSLGTAGLIQSDSALFVGGISAGIGLGFSSLVSIISKQTIQRTRPFETHSEIIPPFDLPNTSSFPSGHTTSAFETATHFSLTFRKWYFVVPAYAWAGTVAWSRLQQGVHYPSDVAAGAILGGLSAWLSFKANGWIGLKTKKFRRKILR